MGVAVIVAPSAGSYEEARRATSTIPIVFCTHGDPIGTGHVASLARPGGNMTGLSLLRDVVNEKKIEILFEAVRHRSDRAGGLKPPGTGVPRGGRAGAPAELLRLPGLGAGPPWVPCLAVRGLRLRRQARKHKA